MSSWYFEFIFDLSGFTIFFKSCLKQFLTFNETWKSIKFFSKAEVTSENFRWLKQSLINENKKL